MKRTRTGARYNLDDQAAASWRDRAATAAAALARVLGTTRRVSVADVGCGDRKLRDELHARGLAFDYTGYDVQPQAPDVVPFDATTGELPRDHDVATLLGVIEYLPDLDGALARLAARVPLVVLSHVVRERSDHAADRVAELGWRNHLTTAELDALLGRLALPVLDRCWTTNGRTTIVCCGRMPAARP